MKKILILLAVLFLVSCKKETIEPQRDNLSIQNNNEMENIYGSYSSDFMKSYDGTELSIDTLIFRLSEDSLIVKEGLSERPYHCSYEELQEQEGYDLNLTYITGSKRHYQLLKSERQGFDRKIRTFSSTGEYWIDYYLK